MKNVKILTLNAGTVIADQCVVAESFLERLVGLMGRTRLNEGEAMLFPRCASVHTWMMRISIDVLALKAVSEEHLQILATHKRVRPWRLLPITHFRSDAMLELPAGLIDSLKLKEGDLLCISSQ